MNGQYKVLNPWAEVDLVPLRGISPRITDMTNKTIGLYASSYKRSSAPMLMVVKEKLKERFPTLKFSLFEFSRSMEIIDSEEKSRFEEWVKGVDAAVSAVGD
jgi:hypothetical protein